MKRRFRSIHRLGVAAASIGWAMLACYGSRVVVAVDDLALDGTFGRRPAWNFAPVEAPWIEAPVEAIEPVEARIGTLVARALEERGLVHSPDRSALLVRFHLVVRRVTLVTRYPTPTRSITGSLVRGQYEVRSERSEEREIDHLRLEVQLLRADDGRPVWVARLRERLEQRFEPQLEHLVERVFERFPAAPFTTAAGGPMLAPR